METVSRNVKDLEFSDRRALENVIGSPLGENQVVVIRVETAGAESPTTTVPPVVEQQVPDWWKIYDGLDDQEIDRLDQAIRGRADLTRDVDS